MRRTLTSLAALVALVCLGAATAAPARPAPVFVLAGGGWGHGVGMSQWGAYGQANAGRDYRTILTTYYHGAAFGAAPDPALRRLRVLVADGRTTLSVSSEKPFVVRNASGKAYELPAGVVTVDSDLELPVGEAGTPTKLVGPLLFRPGKGGILVSGGRAYRGDLRVALVGKRLQLVNLVGLETYLLGVVPGEMPADWPLEALKAQAVAARTYAVASLVKGRSYDLTSDWRTQMYYGATSEAPGPTRAVRGTKGEILTFAGKPITALYSSSSGGRTASAADVYGSEIPYLQSVADPWDVVSPNHQWEPRTFTPSSLAKAFGVPGSVVDAVVVAGIEGRPAELRLTMATGESVAWKLTDVRTRLGLKSTSFRIGVLRLEATAGAVRTGARVRLTGSAGGVDGIQLERLGQDGTWAPFEPALVPSSDDGSFTVVVKPLVTTTYRLVAPGVVGPSVTVKVSETTA